METAQGVPTSAGTSGRNKRFWGGGGAWVPYGVWRSGLAWRVVCGVCSMSAARPACRWAICSSCLLARAVRDSPHRNATTRASLSVCTVCRFQKRPGWAAQYHADVPAGDAHEDAVVRHIPARATFEQMVSKSFGPIWYSNWLRP